MKEATDRELVGENERINLSDITDLERREFSTGKTVGLVVGTVVIIAIFQFLRAMSSFSVQCPAWWEISNKLHD